MKKKTTITVTFELMRTGTDLNCIANYVSYVRNECRYDDCYEITERPETGDNKLNYRAEGDGRWKEITFTGFDDFAEKATKHCLRGYDIGKYLCDYGRVTSLKCVSEDVPEEKEATNG